jgi:hypothetical protein
MKKISVLYASPSTFNAGMQIVDKAWDVFVKRNNLNISYTKYRFDKICFDGGENSGFKCLTDHFEEVLDSDLIIYWGDFLHMPHYHRRKASQLLELGLFPNFEDSFEFVQRCLILKGESISLKKKVISFGTNQMLESTIEKIKEPYFTDIKELIEYSKAWLPRDLNTAHLADIIKKGESFTQGIDCALLYWQNMVEDQIIAIERNKTFKVGCFFGRSSSHFLKMSSFARKVADLKSARLVWVPWISKNNKFAKIQEWLFKYNVHNKSEGYDLDLTKIDWFDKFDFIITDTYHFAVNSWASGTPAICIADTISIQRSSGSQFSWNDKRHMFFQMADALDFFVHLQELDSRKRSKRRANHLIECLDNKNLISWINKKLSMQLRNAEKRLLNAITEG